MKTGVHFGPETHIQFRKALDFFTYILSGAAVAQEQVFYLSEGQWFHPQILRYAVKVSLGKILNGWHYIGKPPAIHV